jgi:hypothetical protein
MVLLVAVLAGAVYFWSARQPVHFLFSRVPESYYELLTAGFRSGHLYVKLDPHPALLALPNPYDPVANAPYRVHDMSLYHGKYYLYYGVTPVLIFFWPIVALTGWYPTEPCAVAAFGLLAVMAGSAFLWAMRRRYFPAAPLWLLALGCLCLAFAGPLLTLTVSANFYQVPIACAAALFLLMAGALYLALHSGRHALGWMGAASLLYGLAVGARPNYLLGGAALLIPWAWLIRRAGAEPGSPQERRIRVRFTVAALGPAALCGLGLALYNALRFGSVLQFGTKYMLAGGSQLNLQLFDLGQLIPNAWSYLAGAAGWQRYFPFFESTAAEPYGLLRYAPWCWFALLAFRPPGGRIEQGSARLTLLRTIGYAMVANLLLLLSFNGSADRYVSDFAPLVLLLAGVGVLALGAWAAGRGWRWAATGILIAAAGGCSLFTELAVFAARTPRADVMLAVGRVANRPVSRWEAMHGARYGALRLELELPQGRAGQAEPLFQTGLSADARDWVQIHYLPDDQAQIGLFHAGLGLFEGSPFPVPASRRISVEVRASSLLPPFAHPLFARWTEEQYQAVRRDFRVSVDGVETLRAAFACYPSAPGNLRIGSVTWAAESLSGPFSGRVLASSRLPLGGPPPPPPILHERTPVELQVLFPADRSAGTEPLLLTGTGSRRDLLSCVYEGPGRLRFVFNHLGYGGPRSEAVAYDPLHPHHLTVWMGSLAPEEGDVASATVLPPARRIAVLLDGAAVFDEEALFYPAAPETVRVGLDPSAPSADLGHFTGLVLDESSAPDLKGLPPVSRSGETGAVDLRVVFPDGMSGSTEPLVATGMSGAGDIVYVHYLDPTHLSFGFHHWGISTLNGAPVEIDYGQPHRLEITLDSLYPPALRDRPFSGRVRVALDGTIVLEGPADCFPSAPYEIRLGVNPLGGSITDPAFTGKILSTERRQPAQLPQAALWEGFGAVAMDTIFPPGLTGAAEPLVEAGAAGAADIIYARYVDDHHVVFGLDHWGTAAAQSDPVEVDYGVPHRLELRMDALQAPGAPRSGRVRVSLDGAEVWQAAAANFPSQPGQIHVALNSIGASSCHAAYTGEILTLARPGRRP